VVWKDQKILFDRLEPRIRSVEWGGSPDVLEGTRWKPVIRRWRAVLSRPPSDPGDVETPKRVIEPAPVEGGKGPGAGPALERELIPGEVTLRLKIDPSRPGAIEVRIEPDHERVLEGRALRASRLEELKKDPKAKKGEELEKIEEIRRMEDLLTRPARLELSVVIWLDVDGPGILDIVRIGEFAAGR
jgi:hypothetical protein